MTNIIDALEQIQQEKKLTNTAMAENLGIGRTSWQRIKKTRVIGNETLLLAARVYPELSSIILGNIPNASQPSPNQKLDRLVARVKGLIFRLINKASGRARK